MTSAVPGQLATIPGTVQQGITETISWSVDMTPNIQGGNAPTSPASTLVDITARPPITVTIPNPTVTGNSVVQTIAGSLLTVGHTYELTLTYTTGTQTLSTKTLIEVPS